MQKKERKEKKVLITKITLTTWEKIEMFCYKKSQSIIYLLHFSDMDLTHSARCNQRIGFQPLTNSC